MKKRLCAACLMLMIGFTSTNLLLACGDKFLISSRGTRYQKAPIKREPHAILIWANPDSELAKGLADARVDETLRKVGYQPTTVATAAEVDSALNRGAWDLVIVGIADAQVVSKRFQSSAPILLPIALHPTDSQMKLAKDQYDVVFKGPVKRESFLNAVDEALAHRSKKSVGKGA
jgi:hypothetical protein